MVAHAARLRSRFCAVRLAIRLRDYQIGLTHKTLKLTTNEHERFKRPMMLSEARKNIRLADSGSNLKEV